MKTGFRNGLNKRLLARLFVLFVATPITLLIGTAVFLLAAFVLPKHLMTPNFCLGVFGFGLAIGLGFSAFIGRLAGKHLDDAEKKGDDPADDTSKGKGANTTVDSATD